MTDYHPQFLCVDGSGATLLAVAGSTGTAATDLVVRRTGPGGAYQTIGGTDFNPARSALGLSYLLTTADDTAYRFSATGNAEKGKRGKGDIPNYCCGGSVAAMSGQSFDRRHRVAHATV